MSDYTDTYIYYDVRFQSHDVNKLNLDIISTYEDLPLGHKVISKSEEYIKGSRVQSSKSAQIERFRLLFLRKNEESLGIK